MYDLDLANNDIHRMHKPLEDYLWNEIGKTISEWLLEDFSKLQVLQVVVDKDLLLHLLTLDHEWFYGYKNEETSLYHHYG